MGHEEVEPSMFFGLVGMFVGLVLLNVALIGYYSSDYGAATPAPAAVQSSTASR